MAIFKLPGMLPVPSRKIASNISIVSTRHKSSRSDEGYEFELKNLIVSGITKVKALISIAATASKHNKHIPVKTNNREQDKTRSHHMHASSNRTREYSRITHHGVRDLDNVHLRAHFSMHGGLTSSFSNGCVSEYSNTELNGETDDAKHVTCCWNQDMLPRMPS